MEKTRNILFEIKNFNNIDIAKCKNIPTILKVNFLCISKMSKTLKVYIHFKNQVRFSTINNLIPKSKRLQQYTDIIENYNWCILNCSPNDIWITGIVPVKNVNVTQKKVEEDIKKRAPIEEMREKYPMWCVMHQEKLKKFYKLNLSNFCIILTDFFAKYFL